MMIPESFDFIRYKYEIGLYSLKQMVEFVEKQIITPEQFHKITSFNYRGVKENRGW